MSFSLLTNDSFLYSSKQKYSLRRYIAAICLPFNWNTFLIIEKDKTQLLKPLIWAQQQLMFETFFSDIPTTLRMPTSILQLNPPSFLSMSKSIRLLLWPFWDTHVVWGVEGRAGGGGEEERQKIYTWGWKTRNPNLVHPEIYIYIYVYIVCEIMTKVSYTRSSTPELL